jgi:hypothetical protein
MKSSWLDERVSVSEEKLGSMELVMEKYTDNDILLVGKIHRTSYCVMM